MIGSTLLALLRPVSCGSVQPTAVVSDKPISGLGDQTLGVWNNWLERIVKEFARPGFFLYASAIAPSTDRLDNSVT